MRPSGDAEATAECLGQGLLAGTPAFEACFADLVG